MFIDMSHKHKHRDNNDDGPPSPPPETPKFERLKEAFGKGEATMLAQAATVGITFGVAIVLGVLGGWWLDKKLGTAPWFFLGGLMVGIGAGFKNLVTVSGRLDKIEKKRAEAARHRLLAPPDKDDHD